MHKKYLVGQITIITAALLLSACGGQATQPATQSPTEAPPQNTAQPQQAEILAYPSPVVEQQDQEVNFASPYPQPAANESPATGSAVDNLLATLQAAGLEAAPGGDVTQDFFSVGGKVLVLNGEELQVFEYPTPEAAVADAGNVAADGSSVGATMIDWISTPHFFHSGNAIVIYVGENQSVVQALQSLLGAQFAGG
jgi:hypothetical protein